LLETEPAFAVNAVVVGNCERTKVARLPMYERMPERSWDPTVL
jgi:hypothetical protein